jgi:hypothetical protein
MEDNSADLSAQVEDLKGSVNTLQKKITTAIDSLDSTIKDLQDQIENGNTADIQSIYDKLTAIKADLESTDVDSISEPPIEFP